MTPSPDPMSEPRGGREVGVLPRKVHASDLRHGDIFFAHNGYDRGSRKRRTYKFCFLKNGPRGLECVRVATGEVWILGAHSFYTMTHREEE